jgi:hypothetical protein
MKRGVDPNMAALDPAMFAQAAAPQGPLSDGSDPEPEAIPENIQNMMAALNVAPGSSAPPAPKGTAVVKSGSALGGYAVRAAARSPVPGLAGAPRPTAASAMAGRAGK